VEIGSERSEKAAPNQRKGPQAVLDAVLTELAALTVFPNQKPRGHLEFTSAPAHEVGASLAAGESRGSFYASGKFELASWCLCCLLGVEIGFIPWK
jgi:hypothetical protein